MYITSVSLTKSSNHVLYIQEYETLFSTLPCQGEDHTTLKCDADDENTKYVYASKDAHDVYLNPNL